jgi:hypothetical protein
MHRLLNPYKEPALVLIAQDTGKQVAQALP